MGEHSSSTALLSHKIALVDQIAASEEHCDSDVDAVHDGTCCFASTCSLCVPLIPSASIIRASIAHMIARLPDEVHLGRSPSPDFRPPKLSANI
jgi:hypothetical protein